MPFIQEAPCLSNLFSQDFAIRTELRRRLSEQAYTPCADLCLRLGEQCATSVEQWLQQAESTPPKHIPYDAWGRRIDLIEMSPAWDKLKAFSALNGFVGMAYDKNQAEFGRIVQTAALYIFSAASATYSCPLAMSDAAARVLIDLAPASLRERLVPRLLSKIPKECVTSGQWMTERTGGSDVSRTETVAQFQSKCGEEDRYTLHGVKWFTSAVTSEMALALARVGDEGLTLFCVEIERDSHQALSGIVVNRLKDKLGTRALPTAELTLDGAVATRIGEVGKGVKSISQMLNITRYYNAVASASVMGRGTALAVDYAQRRMAFGRSISEHILHARTLDELVADSAAALALCFEVAGLLGRTENGCADDAEKAKLRALIPIAKLLLGKQAVAHSSEVLECFGGAGYVEDTGLPRLLRDAQVLPIWEGTTNVLSLDVLRAEKKDSALRILLKDLCVRANHLAIAENSSVRVLRRSLEQLCNQVVSLVREGDAERLEYQARTIAMSTGICTQALLLAESVAYAQADDPGALSRFMVFVNKHMGASPV